MLTSSRSTIANLFPRISRQLGYAAGYVPAKEPYFRVNYRQKSLLVLGTAMLLNWPLLTHAQSQGIGGGSLASRIDTKIKATMEENDIPGMTVAVVQDGRLVYSKGFGWARAVGQKIPMAPDMRTRIGSNSKPAVTVAAAFKLLKQKNIDPKTKKLYGAGSVFGNKFSHDIAIGARRYSPIIGTGMDTDNRTYTWFTNQTFSVGKTFDLDRHQGPRAFDLPAGRRITDIVAMAIADSGRVYTWYSNGTRSIGTPSDLGRYEQMSENEDGEPLKVKLPSGKSSMFDIAGIGIAKTGPDTDHVYVWYQDGTLSSGNTLDFTSHFVGKSYKVTAGKPYTIRSMALSADDHVFAWLANGKAQSGMSHDLARYRQPYSYSLPNQNLLGDVHKRQNWAYAITLQNLLDHEAGFQKNAGSGSSTMFGTSEDSLTYEQIHRYFLRTKPLRWAPGDARSYSNHGFGIWTEIFPALSNRSYREYAIEEFLKPIGMYDAIRPLTVSMDNNDAFPHEITNGQFEIAPAKNSTTGLAAGGWTASASSLLKITTHLTNTYTHDHMKSMGWSVNNGGRLSHNGRTKGGTSYMAIYPEGYVGGGQNVGGIQVALAANIWTSTNALTRLGSHIAIEVPQSGIDDTFDLWQNIQ